MCASEHGRADGKGSILKPCSWLNLLRKTKIDSWMRRMFRTIGHPQASFRAVDSDSFTSHEWFAVPQHLHTCVCVPSVPRVEDGRAAAAAADALPCLTAAIIIIIILGVCFLLLIFLYVFSKCCKSSQHFFSLIATSVSILPPLSVGNTSVIHLVCFLVNWSVAVMQPTSWFHDLLFYQRL